MQQIGMGTKYFADAAEESASHWWGIGWIWRREQFEPLPIVDPGHPSEEPSQFGGVEENGGDPTAARAKDASNFAGIASAGSLSGRKEEKEEIWENDDEHKFVIKIVNNSFLF